MLGTSFKRNTGSGGDNGVGSGNQRGMERELPRSLDSDIDGNTGPTVAVEPVSPISQRMIELVQTIEDLGERTYKLEQRLRAAGLIVSRPTKEEELPEEQTDLGFCAELQSLNKRLEAQRLTICRLHEQALF